MWVRSQGVGGEPWLREYAGDGDESALKLPITLVKGGFRSITREREGKGMRGREGRRKICGEEDDSLHVASQTKDMGNGEANTEPVEVGF